MQFKLLIAAAPLTLLAACGGSAPENESEPAGTATATSDAAMQEAATATPVADATDTAATGETPSPTTAAATPTPSPAAVASNAAPAVAPPAAFAQCRTCHSVEPGKNGVGPTLFGIVGSKAGDVKGYSFSPALAKSGIVWDRASLDTWLKAPMKMVPGTKMVISQPDAAKRKEIIDYLETLK